MDSFKDTEFIVSKNHPYLTVKKMEEFDFIPSDVIRILNEHHERPNGTG